MTHIYWYCARSAGFLTYLFAWGSVVWGLLLSARIMPRVERATLFVLHRLLALGSLIFLAVHLVSLYLDPWARFSVRDLLVPFAATYRPFWMSLGILAAGLLVTIAATSLLQTRLPRVLWRAVHYLSFLTFVIGLLHGIGAGTDTRQLWATLAYGITGAVVAGLCVQRVVWVRAPAGVPARAAVPRRVEPRAHTFSDLPTMIERREAVATDASRARHQR